jgi:hypothetical protein
MDVDDMQGSTLQAMASAVEKADIVLVCYSQKYKNSDNCRAGSQQTISATSRSAHTYHGNSTLSIIGLIKSYS